MSVGRKIGLFVLMVMVISIGGALFYGTARWQRATHRLREQQLAARRSARAPTYDAQEIDSLPAPVQRYFRTVLQDGQPIVSTAQVATEGQFVVGETRENWHGFHAQQMFTAQPPGFDWDARINMAPGIAVFVRDAYIVGKAALHAEVMGLITVADTNGTPELAQGELLRHLAETLWFPTALLPSQGVTWEAVDDTTARATLIDSATSVWLEFRFGQDGLIAAAWTPGRFGTFQGAMQAQPWHVTYRAYAQREGMLIPLESEVVWQLPEGDFPYWRGRVTDVAYAYAEE